MWPGTHVDEEADLSGVSPVDVISPLIEMGDALVFDGLLSHCGMENVSREEDRFIFYAAFSSLHDPNTDVTGY